jgi:hypothetical protein
VPPSTKATPSLPPKVYQNMSKMYPKVIPKVSKTNENIKRFKICLAK